MKKLIFGLLATVVFSNFVEAQTSQRRKILCITESCCGIGPFEITIYSVKTCHYVSVEQRTNGTSSSNNRISYLFDTKELVKEVNVKEDVILAGQYDSNGDNFVMPAGTYPVKDKQIDFTPTSLKAKKYCYIRETSGNFLGHDFEYTIKICVEVSLKSNKGALSITPTQNSSVKPNNLESSKRNTFSINKDVKINEDGFNFVIKAGEYILNDDGTAYINNVKLK